MRMRCFPSGLAQGLVAGALLLLAAACDDVTAGQLLEDPAPPTLVKLLVQDETPSHGRGIATDLLDRAPAKSCDDADPCTTDGDLGYPNPSCQIPGGMTSGLCPDQLSDACGTPNGGDSFGMLTFGAPYDSCGAATSGPRPVYLGTPIVGGGNSIRLVFSKLLNPTIEAVVTDPMTGLDTYTLAAGAVELDGPDGNPVALVQSGAATGGGAYYDAGGSPLSSSDPIGVPFGPAIVLKPLAPLAPNSAYSVKVDPTKIVDHMNQAVSNIASPYTFTTEGLALLAATPDVTADAATVLPNDVIQLALNADVILAPGSVTLGCGGVTIAVEVWKDLGTTCTPTAGLIDVVAVSSPGSPVDLPNGMVCTLAVAGWKDTSLGKSTFAASYRFTVKGPDDPTDLSAVANFTLPESCTFSAADGGATD